VSFNRQEELRNIRKLSIVDLLSMQGFKPSKIFGNKYWYLSPLRDEKEASFCVYKKPYGNDWYDYGINRGGSIIDLVMEMNSWNYVEAIRQLRKLLIYFQRQTLTANRENL